MLKAGRFISGILVIRFLLFPGLFYLFYFILFKPQGYTTAQLWILFLMTHTPPALNLSVMAAQGGVNKELTSYTFLITYSVYIVLLPLFLLIFFGLPGLF
jgi:predicted permease